MRNNKNMLMFQTRMHGHIFLSDEVVILWYVCIYTPRVNINLLKKELK